MGTREGGRWLVADITVKDAATADRNQSRPFMVRPPDRLPERK